MVPAASGNWLLYTMTDEIEWLLNHPTHIQIQILPADSPLRGDLDLAPFFKPYAWRLGLHSSHTHKVHTHTLSIRA